MGNLLRLKLDSDLNVKEFLSFLDFHQFQYKVEEEAVLNIETLVNEKNIIVLVDENKLEEFKVLVLVYKDLLANKNLRHLNIPIENSLIDYENTRKINTIELIDNEEPKGDGVFTKIEEGNIPPEKNMEDSFYGHKKKKKTVKNSEPLLVILNKDDFKEQEDDILEFDEGSYKGTQLIKDLFKVVGLLVFTSMLILTFILIR